MSFCCKLPGSGGDRRPKPHKIWPLDLTCHNWLSENLVSYETAKSRGALGPKKILIQFGISFIKLAKLCKKTKHSGTNAVVWVVEYNQLFIGTFISGAIGSCVFGWLI